MPKQGMNKVILIGAVASEPRFKLTPVKQTPRLWFRVCVEEPFNDEHGVARERRSYHSVVVWGPRATGLETFLREGHLVAVEGRLTTRQYDHVGQKRYETEIIVRDLVVLGSPATAARQPDRSAA